MIDVVFVIIMTILVIALVYFLIELARIDEQIKFNAMISVCIDRTTPGTDEAKGRLEVIGELQKMLMYEQEKRVKDESNRPDKERV